MSRLTFVVIIDIHIFIVRHTLPFLETMVTQNCNLSCHGCTNYSDLKHSGYVTWEQGQQWIRPWIERLDIPDFGIMGGEPLLNPEIESWLLGVRQLLPKSQIRFTTNGLLLNRWPNLFKLIMDIGNCVFKVSVHVQCDQLDQQLETLFANHTWQPVVEHGIERWITTNNVRLQINRPRFFIKTYRNRYHDMMPYHSVPSEAFSKCVQQTCPLLWQGKIYKCSTAGLLGSTLERLHWPNFDQWQPLIDTGLSPDCDEHRLVDFVNNFGKPHAQCAQCPSGDSGILDHARNVAVKKVKPALENK